MGESLSRRENKETSLVRRLSQTGKEERQKKLGSWGLSNRRVMDMAHGLGHESRHSLGCLV